MSHTGEEIQASPEILFAADDLLVLTELHAAVRATKDSYEAEQISADTYEDELFDVLDTVGAYLGTVDDPRRTRALTIAVAAISSGASEDTGPEGLRITQHGRLVAAGAFHDASQRTQFEEYARSVLAATHSGAESHRVAEVVGEHFRGILTYADQLIEKGEPAEGFRLAIEGFMVGAAPNPDLQRIAFQALEDDYAPRPDPLPES